MRSTCPHSKITVPLPHFPAPFSVSLLVLTSAHSSLAVLPLSCLFYAFPSLGCQPQGCGECCLSPHVHSQLHHRRSLNFCQMPEREQGSLQTLSRKIESEGGLGPAPPPPGILESLTGWGHQKPSESLGQGVGMVEWSVVGRAEPRHPSPFHHCFLTHLPRDFPVVQWSRL